MKRWRFPEILLGVFLAVAIFVIGYSFARLPTQQIEGGRSDASGAQSYAQQDPLSAFWQFLISFVNMSHGNTSD